MTVAVRTDADGGNVLTLTCDDCHTSAAIQATPDDWPIIQQVATASRWTGSPEMHGTHQCPDCRHQWPPTIQIFGSRMPTDLSHPVPRRRVLREPD